MSKFSSKQFWEDRYSQGGNSGGGSYGNSATLKATIINDIIKRYKIKSINDHGHGDGNNIALLEGYDQYTGYDVSKTARDICIHKFKDHTAKRFISRETMFKKADLALSLDVLYHLVEEKVYTSYLKKLFSKCTYVLIYAQDFDGDVSLHCRSRKFTTYIEETFPDYKLIETINGYHSKVKFYLNKS